MRPIVSLRPSVKRMLVALSAFQTHAQERGRRSFAHFLQGGRSANAPEQVEARSLRIRSDSALLCGLIDRLEVFQPLLWRSSVAAGGTQHTMNQIVVGHVGREPFAQPIVPHLAVAGLQFWV